MGQLPSKPSAPAKIEEFSSQTQIMVRWQLVAETDGIPITGYQLMIDDGYAGEFVVAYDGSGQPQVKEKLIIGLTTGLPYRVMLIA